ncbi:MAG: hypothetical protein GX232_02725 [Acholeplasmataceae bacterium]|nr:hypothetical protein [Acholeplasmataceae bacterium]
MKKIVFPYVEAGMGHIMPLKAVAEVFKKKYGDKVEVVETYFFRDQNNEEAIKIEQDFIKQVKLHNRFRGLGRFQFFLMRLVGQKTALKFLHKQRYKIGYKSSIEYIESLNADLIFNTHFSTLYYCNEAKEKGLTKAKVVAYCPDPVLGLQWDKRYDLMVLSSEKGILKALRSKTFKDTMIRYAPFMIRPEIKEYIKDKIEYKKELGLEDEFTILLCDGAYGAGKMDKVLKELLKSKHKMNILAVCGKNEKLYEKLQKSVAPQNTNLKVFGFTDKMLLLAAASDIFIGKSGASNLAEASYFENPLLITSMATNIEVWIADYYINEIKNAKKVFNVKEIRGLIESYIDNPNLLKIMQNSAKKTKETSGPEKTAYMIYELLKKN